MASKKGMALTAGVLAAITAASFAVWLVPSQGPSVVIGDYEAHLAGSQQIQYAAISGLEPGFEGVLDGTVDPDEYIAQARASSDQIRSELVIIASNSIPDEWSGAYAHQAESLRGSNSYVRETIAIATMVRDGADAGEARALAQEAENLLSINEGAPSP